MLLTLTLIIAGFLILGTGAELMVNGSSRLTLRLGISPLIIGLTVVAFGTSAPELATSAAALRKQSDLAVGNVIGSNTFNILCVLGFTALLCPVSGSQLEALDFGIMLVYALLLLPLARSGLVLSRLEGTLLLAGYCGYVTFIGIRAV